VRKNTTKNKLQKGESVYGLFCTISAPAIVEMAGLLGFDFVIIDAEHGPMDLETCEHMIRAADSVGITPIVRVAVNLRQNILRYLDAGALGVMLPMVNTREEAHAVVESVKYPPMGRRGLAGVRANSYALNQGLADYVKDANRETLVMTQVETMDAVRNIGDMAKVEGLDVLFVGPTDLSASMGYPGQADQPQVRETITKLAHEIAAGGKVAGSIAYDLDTLRARKKDGFRLLVAGVTSLLAKSSREYLAAARGSLAKP